MARKFKFFFAPALLVAFGASGGCIDPESPLIEESAEGCDEFSVDRDVSAELDVDQDVRFFMQASVDFIRATDDMQAAVLDACSAVATDLGAEDTWSDADDLDSAISNDARTGACDAAGSRIEDILVEAGRVEANVAIAVSRGECHLDFEEQARCDAACEANAECEPGTVVTRCEPGSLSVMCERACEASASCVGTPELPANCMGKCQSQCVGECQGTCIGEDGTRTENNPNCVGKCASSCNGMCRGMCKVEAPEGIDCGVSETFSLGARATAELLFLNRRGVPVRDLLAPERVETLGEARVRALEADGSSIGSSYALTIGPGVHF